MILPDVIVDDHADAVPEQADYLPRWYREEMSRMGACHADACRQGREPCATPQACRLSEEQEDRNAMQMLAYLLVIAVVVTAALLMVVLA